MGRWLVLVLLVVPTNTGACWLDVPLRSFHTDRTAGYNESNLGFGLDCRLAARWDFVVGQYRNSLHETTRYVGVDYTPWRSGRWQVGVRTALATGYADEAQVMPIPIAKYRGELWGAGFVVVPPIPGLTKEGVLGFWVSRRF